MPNPNKEHDIIVRALFELCNGHVGDSGKKVYSKVYADHISEDYKPIILNAYMPKRKPIAKYYYPDVWTQVREKEQFDVFEVWHTEEEFQAVQDILFASLVRGIRYFHVVCTGFNIREDNAKELVNLVLRRVHNEEGKKLLDPNNVLIAELPDKVKKDESAIKAYLGINLDFQSTPA
jgi:hypothetical protein